MCAEGLHGRLADPSADVREQVVDVVSAAAQQDAAVLAAVPAKLIIGVTERMQDRQVCALCSSSLRRATVAHTKATVWARLARLLCVWRQ